MPPAMRSRAATMSASVSATGASSEGQRDTRLGVVQHALELALDARERRLVVGLEAQHDHGCRVGAAREAEAIRVFDPQAVDADHVGRTGKLRGLAELLDQRMMLAFLARDV